MPYTRSNAANNNVIQFQNLPDDVLTLILYHYILAITNQNNTSEQNLNALRALTRL